jgi:hypothetical protein
LKSFKQYLLIVIDVTIQQKEVIVDVGIGETVWGPKRVVAVDNRW